MIKDRSNKIKKMRNMYRYSMGYEVPLHNHVPCTPWASESHITNKVSLGLGHGSLPKSYMGWNYSPLLQRRVNTLRPRQNGRLFADDIFNRIFLSENCCVSILIHWNLSQGSKNAALGQIMAWRRIGVKPSSDPKMSNLKLVYWGAISPHCDYLSML